mmetsp:Transcript_160427/g.514909  ORF Transcript_160427/g.514909 Transcript_160427/m.514909 type:complete len:226 (+) Transcript_160427:639-1316(+)
MDLVTRRASRPHGNLKLRVGGSSPISLRARARLHEDGVAVGAVGVGLRVGDVSVAYEATGRRIDTSLLFDAGDKGFQVAALAAALGEATSHVLEVKYSPAAQVQDAYKAARSAISTFSTFNLPTGGAEIWARITRSALDHGGRPRIQLGLSYNLGRIKSEEVSFDSSREEDAALLDQFGRSLEARMKDRAAKMQQLDIVKKKFSKVGSSWFADIGVYPNTGAIPR